MKLLEALEELHDEDMIFLGAQSSFLYIAPKPQMIEWLIETSKTTTSANRKLAKDQKEGKRLNEQPIVPFINREVKSCFYCENRGYVTVIDGTEQGKYALRSEITGEATKPHDIILDDGVLQLITEVLADIASDITYFEAFKKFYCNGNQPLSVSGQIAYDKLKLQSEKSIEFLLDPQQVGKWTEIDGGYIVRCAMKNIDNRIAELKRFVIRKVLRDRPTWSKLMTTNYEKEIRTGMYTMIGNGATSAEIIQKYGIGKKKTITGEFMSDLIKTYHVEVEKERKRYLADPYYPKPKKSANTQKEVDKLRERQGGKKK